MKSFQRTIFFTKIPLGGCYKFKDIFQIYPADLSKMPDSNFKKHYPNILEYWYTKDEEISPKSEIEELQGLRTLAATTVTKEDRILSLLTSFTNNLFFKYRELDGFWGIPMLYDEINQDVAEEINSWSSKWCMIDYIFPALPDQMRIQEFAQPEINQIQRIPHNVYFTYNPNLDWDRQKTISLPSTIDLMFDSYYSLPTEEKTTINSAIDFNVSAIELGSTKKTLSLLASFTAVETMVNLEFRNAKNEKCEVCNQQRFSIAKKFREYLLSYIGHSTENKKKFNSYYSLRSKIVHTGMQLKSEKLFSDISKDEYEQEYINRLEILQIGKMAIANWLIKRNNPHLWE